MASNLRVDTILPSTGTNVAIGTASSSVTFLGDTDITTSGSVSIGGTLTYEDVTNVDSVGVITARSGINVTSGSIGINTTGGNEKLNAFGAIRSSGSSVNFNAGLEGTLIDYDTLNRISRVGHVNGASGSARSLVFLTGGGERLRVGPAGQLGIGGANYGTSGQVLTSQGSGSPVQWATPSSGLSDFDTWYLTADTVGNTNPLQNNWSRWTSRGGTGTVTFAAPSSGIWTFPSTGYWLIEWHARFQVTNAEERGCNADIYVTEDNTSYYFVNQSSVNMIQNSLAVKGNAIASYIFDVTDVSTHKMKVACGYQMVSGTLTGHGAYLYSHIKFFKLRDT